MEWVRSDIRFFTSYIQLPTMLFNILSKRFFCFLPFYFANIGRSADLPVSPDSLQQFCIITAPAHSITRRTKTEQKQIFKKVKVKKWTLRENKIKGEKVKVRLTADCVSYCTQKQNNLGWKWKWTLNHLSNLILFLFYFTFFYQSTPD